MANFLGNLLSVARQTLAGDVMQNVGQFEVVEIPASQLRSNDIFIRIFEDKLVSALADVVYLLNHPKTGKVHVAVRFQCGTTSSKIFSIYRDVDSTRAIDVANKFRSHSQLLILSENENNLKRLIECIHSKPAWDGVHYAAAVGSAKFFATLRNDNETAKLITTPCPLTGVLPIHIAVDNNRIEIVNCLLSLGADVAACDLNGMNAFHYAASVSGNMVQALSKHRDTRSAVNAINGAGRTPLFIAVIIGKPDCVAALLNAGAVGTFRCEGITVLEAAIKGSATMKTECAEEIAKAIPALIVEPDADGATPLHYCHDPKISKLLARAIGNNAAYFDIRDGAGETPLHSAIRRADLSAVVNFIAHGATIDAPNPDGQTPLHLSLSLVKEAGQLEILKALLALGASCSIPDGEGRLPRHVAACGFTSPVRGQVAKMFEVVDAERCPPQQKTCVDACRFVATSETNIGPTKFTELHELRQESCLKMTKEKKHQGNRMLNLLALDGGGVKGLVLIQILVALEKFFGAGKLLERFNWVAGTSTGAIVAAAFCQGRSLRDIQRLYFRLKDVVFDGKMRPYNSALLERFLKEELGNTFTIGDIVKPKLLITTAMADVNPIKLVLIRNYRLPLSSGENHALGYEDPKTWPLWKAVRCSSAAPTYFSRVDNRFVDGGLVANNPTLDLLAEVTNYEFALKISQDGKGTCSDEVGCVVSVGCGEAPDMPVLGSLDIGKVTGVMDAVGSMVAMKNLGEILINQVTNTGGRPVDRSRAWCHTMNVPFFRFSPTLFKDIPLDATDDSTLIQMLWCTLEYLHENRLELQKVAELLS